MVSLTVSVLSILCIRERRLIIDGDCRCSPPIESVDQTPPENSEQDDSPQTEEEQIEALLNMGHEIEREGKEFVLIRSSGLISPNRYTTQRYLEGYEGVLIFYNESNNTLVIKPVNNYEPDEGRKFPPPSTSKPQSCLIQCSNALWQPRHRKTRRKSHPSLLSRLG